ncbi:MAG: class I SAM-dependent DNA methyltransferase [Promethearchaeota archaeon]
MAYQGSAKYYDLFATDKGQEQNFYREIAKETGSPVLELGVGTGLFAFLLAEDGIEVVGIDSSSAMLKEAMRKQRHAPQAIASRLTFIKADMSNFQLDQMFHLIYVPSGSFQYLTTPEEQKRCLQCVQSHLYPQGLFVFDVYLGETEATGAWRRLETKPLPKGGTVTRSISTQTLKDQRAINTALRFDVTDSRGRVQETIIDWSYLALLTKEELEQHLKVAELDVTSLYATFTRKPWAPGATKAIFVTAKPGK